MLIYKIFRGGEWESLQSEGETHGAPVDVADGYIHFSTADTLRATAEKYFAHEDGLILVAVEAEGLEPLEWEPARGGTLFPHLYRPLRLADVVWDAPLPRDGDRFRFPDLT